MSGGKIVVTPPSEAVFAAAENAILGNCALYGATGGTLYANGLAGNRFAVRNSGATAIVEGAGMHACEYMTRGTVVILGSCGPNIGAGMTGGVLYLNRDFVKNINDSYLKPTHCSDEDLKSLREFLEDYRRETASATALEFLENWDSMKRKFVKCLPVSAFKKTTETLPTRSATELPRVGVSEATL